MPVRLPIGYDDFRMLREEGLEYVDKSDMIRELIERPGGQVVLLPRPRRFGKTLNLSMLRCWFEKTGEDLSHLFSDLSIWRAGEEVRAHFQRYPVISLSFKETKLDGFERTLEAIRKKIQALYGQHAYLVDIGRLHPWQRADFQAILDGTASRAVLDRALLDLSACLHAHHGQRVIILIDEYDEPIHAGYLHGYSKEILDFMRAFLGAGLKGNPHLQRAVMTGILRVAKENMFSGLNNLSVYSLLRPEHCRSFGFTETEVAALAERCHRSARLDEIRAWYNGYLFGGEVIYNPWSVLCFLDSVDGRARPYWLSTSSNDLVKELLERYALDLEPVFEDLLSGGGFERVLEENVALNELHRSQDALWSLLVLSGYLKAEEVGHDPMRGPVHRLSIPNREVRQVYATTFQFWMEQRMSGHGGGVDRLTRALLGGDAERLEEQLQAFVKNMLSYHDPGSLDPERVHHGFVVGLLAVMEGTHEVRSNRESGGGRPDVWIRPRKAGQAGAVLELKVARPRKKTLKQALSEGLSQLEGMDYAAELRASGAVPVHAFAVAFDGKEVRVAAVEPAAPGARTGESKAGPRRARKGKVVGGAKGKGVVAAKPRPARRRGG
jgi:hypothetical protein